MQSPKSGFAGDSNSYQYTCKSLLNRFAVAGYYRFGKSVFSIRRLRGEFDGSNSGRTVAERRGAFISFLDEDRHAHDSTTGDAASSR